MATLETFEKMLEKGPDNALLRYSLANACISADRHSDAIEHLCKAVEHDNQYSAAWKLLGRCYFDTEDYRNAVSAYESGIAVADSNGDLQAGKEMRVFLKRAKRKLEDKNGND